MKVFAIQVDILNYQHKEGTRERATKHKLKILIMKKA